MIRPSHLRALRAALLLAAAALPPAARAHHGVAAVGVAGPEGPGAALETTSALPLAEGAVLAMAKLEHVPYQQRAAGEPEPKRFSTFGTLALGYGLRPWLSIHVFQPVSAKDQDGVGRNVGLADPSVMLHLGLVLDDGRLRLVPERESLDELEDWHLGVWVSSTIPAGSTTARDDRGDRFAPDMQTGFGAPSPAAGVAALKQVTRTVTWLGEASYQHFLPHAHLGADYQFGGETRLNTAAVWRVHGAGRFRLDASLEANGLHLQRDRAEGSAGHLERLDASGGAILYAGAGLRAQLGAFSAALGVRRAAWRALNEGRDQQGSEGLETLRAALTLAWSARP